MATNPKSPFDDERVDNDSAGVNAQEPDESIQQGKTKKNLKNALYAVGIIVLFGFLLWEQITDVKKTSKADKPVVIEPSTVNAPGSIVTEMEKIAANKQAPQPSNDALPGPQYGVSAEGQRVGNSGGDRGVQKPTTSKDAVDERRATVLASSMEPDGVELAKPEVTRIDTPQPLSREYADAKRQADLQEQLISAQLHAVRTGGVQSVKEQPQGIGEAFLARYANQSDEAVNPRAAYDGAPLYQGSTIRAVLTTGINSDQPGEFTARVTSDVYDSISGRRLVIPKGSVLIGAHSTQVLAGQSRLLAAMRRINLPNGQTISLAGAPASDTSGATGLEADVNNHFLKMFGSSLLVGTMSLLLPKEDQSVSISSSGGAPVTAGTVAARALQTTVETLADRNKGIRPTLTIPAGEVFTFRVAKDMLLGDYK